MIRLIWFMSMVLFLTVAGYALGSLVGELVGTLIVGGVK